MLSKVVMKMVVKVVMKVAMKVLVKEVMKVVVKLVMTNERLRVLIYDRQMDDKMNTHL